MKKTLLKLKYLCPNRRRELEARIWDEHNKLSVRAKNVARDIATFDNILSYIYPEVHFYGLNRSNCGHKTQFEICSCLTRMREICDSYLADIDINEPVPVYTHSEVLYTELKHNYPFLADNELKKIVNFERVHGNIPFLYIIRQYILIARQRSQVLIRNFYGINSERVRYPLSELAQQYNLTVERCRQISVSPFTLEHPDLINYVNTTLHREMDHVITPGNRLPDKLRHEQMLENESTEYMICLLAALSPTHIMFMIADDAEPNLVDPSLLKNVKPRKALSLIKKELNVTRHTEPFELDVRPYITHEDNAVYDTNVNELSEIYIRYLTQKHGCTPLSEYTVTAPANKIDIVRCAADILRENNSPMIIDDLWKQLNMRHPKHHVTNISYFKFLLCRSDIVRPKGKSGIYTLTEWSDQFLGTITDYIYELVSRNDTPITFDELVNKVLEQFPTANRSSINSLIHLDKKHKYTFFENDMVGIQDKAYDNQELIERQIVQRYCFEDNYKRLEDFIAENHRFPVSHNKADNAEIHLQRWMSNVKYNNISVTVEQHAAIDRLIAQHSTLPQNGREYRFHQRCREILHMVQQTGTLPKASTHPNLRAWYNIQLLKYTQYTDNRRLFFEELLQSLREMISSGKSKYMRGDRKALCMNDSIDEQFYTPSLFDGEV